MQSVRKLSRTDSDLRLNGLLYGDPGAGKTLFGAMATLSEAMRDVLMVNMEGGMLTVRDMNFEHPPLEIRIQSPSDMEELFWALKKKSDEFASVKTVVIDSATEWVARDLEATVTSNMTKKTRGGKQRKGVDDVWLEDRGETNQRIARLLRWYRDLDVNLMVTAHPRYTYPVNGEGMQQRDQPPKRVEPAFGPSLNKHVCGYMDFVWFMQKDATNAHVNILTASTDNYYAKTRGATLAKQLGGVLRWSVDDPILPRLHATVTQNVPFKSKEGESNDE